MVQYQLKCPATPWPGISIFPLRNIQKWVRHIYSHMTHLTSRKLLGRYLKLFPAGNMHFVGHCDNSDNRILQQSGIVLNDLMQDSLLMLPVCTSDMRPISQRSRGVLVLLRNLAMTYQQDSSLGTCVCTSIWRSLGFGREQNRKKTLHMHSQGTISYTVRPTNLRARKLYRPSSTLINHWNLNEDFLIIAHRGVSSFFLLHSCFVVQQR